jgi:nucleoside-diphosphate-sugar epimerase
MTRTVVLAGAAGNLGRKLAAHFATLGWQLRLLDRDGDGPIVGCDLSVWDENWAAHFAGADAVVLLAADPSPKASWDSVQRLNLDLPLNVYEAAARGGVRRLIFASSNWVMAGHRVAEGPITTEMSPAPVNAYGASKLVAERIGHAFSVQRGLSVICLRIGYTQRGENLPGPAMGWSEWGQAMWLSNRDFVHGVECAITAPDDVRFAVLNLMSDNPGMRWDLEATRRTIGYAPADGAAPVPHPDAAEREARVRAAREEIAAREAWLAESRW